ncbi:hypothetical protein [Rhizobium sp. BK176]|uniref:hypothetical protein n=1 Tax=Rhizobium sp. BK176 TaxID=2587071 RepID=UPI00216839F6|nr:hypothetical protein [Rhizobium sp. BK176]MCS4088839.1 hypothetical protein [Rhizobium sp. BK176]
MTDENHQDEQADDTQYRHAVAQFVAAYARDDGDLVAQLFPRVCDNPAFDRVLADSISDIGEDSFDPLEFGRTVLSMSSVSLAPYLSSQGKAHAIVQLFFVPLSGVLGDLQKVADSTDTLNDIAGSFLGSELAAGHSSIVACGSLLDPLAASSITPGTLRLALRMISPVLTGRVVADNLGEALASVFGVDTTTEETPGAANVYANRLLPVARIVTPPDGVHVDDHLSAHRIDARIEQSTAVTSWKRHMGKTLPATVQADDPCSIARGCAVMAINTIEHSFSLRAMRRGHVTMPDFDRILVHRSGDGVTVTAQHGIDVYGPVRLPANLFAADLDRMSNYIDSLSGDVAWNEDKAAVPASKH